MTVTMNSNTFWQAKALWLLVNGCLYLYCVNAFQTCKMEEKNIVNFNSLIGHIRKVQLAISTLTPTQSRPPFCGAGLSQDRFLKL